MTAQKGSSGHNGGGYFRNRRRKSAICDVAKDMGGVQAARALHCGNVPRATAVYSAQPHAIAGGRTDVLCGTALLVAGSYRVFARVQYCCRERGRHVVLELIRMGY